MGGVAPWTRSNGASGYCRCASRCRSRGGEPDWVYCVGFLFFPTPGMTSIGSSVVITGELVSDEDLTLDGRVVGHVHVREATLTIGEAARLEADVRGTRVIVRGNVKGSIAATERIEVTAGAAVFGNLSANRVVV